MLDYEFLINILKNAELSISEKNNIKAYMSGGIPLSEQLKQKITYIKYFESEKDNKLNKIFKLR